MMSSVIPARLQFQCGHAALVTLPRIKGESSAQRNERIAREKSAALSRQCDFCGPTVQVALSTPDGANGGHMFAAELTAPEVETVVIESVTAVEEPSIVEEAVVLMEQEGLIAEEELVVLIEEEPVILVEEEPVVVVEEPVIIVEEEPVVVIAEVLPQEIDAQQHKARTNGTVGPKPTRKPRTQSAKREVVATQPAAPRKFVVEYRMERVLKAADIRDALRQAAALGAVNVLAATRED